MIQIDQERCIGCGLCVKDCIAFCIKLQNGKAAAQGDCLNCGHCAAICPQQAVTIPAYPQEKTEPCQIRLDAADLLRTIKSRRSIRQYQPRSIEREKLELLVEAGRYTATAKNTQGCRFVLVQEGLNIFKEMIWRAIREAVAVGQLPPEVAPTLLQDYKRFLTLLQQEPPVDYLFRNAPAVLFIGANTPVDAGLAAQNIELMALAQGLGVLYNGYLNYTIALTPQLQQWLDLSDKKSYVCMLLGYPAVSYTTTAPRREADVVWR